MLKINFDLFYELKHGSIISNTDKNTVKYWRIFDGNLEMKTIISNQIQQDWQQVEMLTLPIAGNFEIVERFQRFNNG
jgi:hypothetical protein